LNQVKEEVFTVVSQSLGNEDWRKAKLVDPNLKSVFPNPEAVPQPWCVHIISSLPYGIRSLPSKRRPAAPIRCGQKVFESHTCSDLTHVIVSPVT